MLKKWIINLYEFEITLKGGLAWLLVGWFGYASIRFLIDLAANTIKLIQNELAPKEASTLVISYVLVAIVIVMLKQTTRTPKNKTEE